MRIMVVALGLLLAGCAVEVDGAAVGRPAPSRELVVWADRMCLATTAFANLKESNGESFKEVVEPPSNGFPHDPGFKASTYLSQASTWVDQFVKAFADVEPTGIHAADELRAGYAKEFDRIKAEVESLSDSVKTSSLAANELVNNAKRVNDLIASLNAPQPDLPAVVKGEPALADAHRLAPQCVPPAPPSTSSTPPPQTTGPLPQAKDGSDLSACKDGTCQVMVSGPVDITIGDITLNVTVKDARVTIRLNYGNGGSSTITLGAVGGKAKFGQLDKGMITITVAGLNDEGAVLDVAPE